MQLFNYKIKYKKRAILLFFFLFVFVGLFLKERSQVLQRLDSGVINNLPRSDCGVVLTGSAGRIREAFEILSLKKVGKLIVSGVYKDAQLHEIFPQLLNYPDVEAQNIVLEKVSGSTRQNAVESLLVVQNLKCKNILLITSQLHMNRAYRTFKGHFPDNIEILTYSVVSPGKEDSELAVFFETVKSLFYSLLLYL